MSDRPLDPEAMLMHEIDLVCQRARQEYDLSYNQVIGILSTLHGIAVQEHIELLSVEEDDDA